MAPTRPPRRAVAPDGPARTTTSPSPGSPVVGAQWRGPAEAEGPSIRQTVIASTARQSLIGHTSEVAAALDEFVRSGAADGFVLVPHPAPGALDGFVGRVVPLLQERGALRAAYPGTTLRSQLGLGEPDPGLGAPGGTG